MDIKLYNSYYVYRFGVDEFPREEVPVALTAGRQDETFCSLLIRPDDQAIVSVGENTAFSMYGLCDNYRVEAFCTDLMDEVFTRCKLIGKVPDDANVNVSDIVLESDYIECRRGEGQQVMIRVWVGDVTGEKTIRLNVYRSRGFGGEELVKTYDIPLTVYDYEVPQPADYRFHLDLWQHNSNIARKHDVSLWSEEHFDVIEDYVRTLSELGQKSVTVIASEIPWSGQRGWNVTNYPSDLYEYSMASVQYFDGSFHYDFTKMQRYIDLCFKYGINREIEIFGLINVWVDEDRGFGKAAANDPDAVRVRYYNEETGLFGYMDNNEDIKEYIHQLERYFIVTGQIQYVRVVADEPADVEAYRVSLNRLREAAPSFKYKVAINHIEFIEEFGDCISDIVPTINFAAEKADYMTARAKEGKGRTLLYVCCGPDYPNTFLKSEPFEIEAITAFIYKLGLDGFLRWNYTVWPQNPRERLSFRAPGWKAGDTNFVYPGNNGKALLSLRWYFLKRAILHYELLSRAAEKAPETVKRVFDLLFVDQDPAAFRVTTYGLAGCKLPGELYSQNPEDYENARKLLLEVLSGQ